MNNPVPKSCVSDNSQITEESSDMITARQITNRYQAVVYRDQKTTHGEIFVNREAVLKIYLNDAYFVSILCSPADLDELVIGYLFNEGIIGHLSDISELSIDEKTLDAYVRLSEKKPPENENIRTSGFGGGLMLNERINANVPDETYTVNMRLLVQLSKIKALKATAYALSGGIHSSALCDRDRVVAFVEDIGRHNTLDKICGFALKNNISAKNMILMTSGRISFDMVRKGCALGTPVILSLSAATEKAVEAAAQYNLTLIGYFKEHSCVIYTNDFRVVFP